MQISHIQSAIFTSGCQQQGGKSKMPRWTVLSQHNQPPQHNHHKMREIHGGGGGGGVGPQAFDDCRNLVNTTRVFTQESRKPWSDTGAAGVRQSPGGAHVCN